MELDPGIAHRDALHSLTTQTKGPRDSYREPVGPRRESESVAAVTLYTSGNIRCIVSNLTNRLEG